MCSGCVKHNRNFPCGKSLFPENILTRYLRRIISMWGQSEKSIAAWLHCIRTKKMQDPVITPFFMIHHPPILEASTRPDKHSCSSINSTQLDYLSSNLLSNIDMCHAGIVHRNKLKPLLVQLTQHHPVLRTSAYHKLKYIPFE